MQPGGESKMIDFIYYLPFTLLTIFGLVVLVWAIMDLRHGSPPSHHQSKTKAAQA
jgi:hypothetical protein